MPTPDVLAKIRQLDTQLGQTQPSPATRPVYDQVRLAVSTAVAEPDSAAQYSSLRDRLRDAYASFETDHPTVAEAMQGVISSLSNAGI
jgi:Domain of unknown function (DUF4404)